MKPVALAGFMFRHMQTGGFMGSVPTIICWLFRGGNVLPDRLNHRIFPLP